MTRSHLTWVPTVMVVAAAAAFWIHLQRDRTALAVRRAGLEGMADHSQTQPKHPPQAFGKVEPQAQPFEELTAMVREIRAEETALAQLKRQAGDLAARLPPADADELITSFGKVEDMGREAGAAVRSLLLGVTADPDKRVDESGILQLLQVKGRLPEIRSFEDNPNEIARFQSSALRQALGLSDATEMAIQPLIRDAFAGMAGQNLTAARGSAENAEAWRERRSQALQQLMLKLRPHLPDSDSAATRQALTFVLNLGAGVDERYNQEEGKATVTLGVRWPKVPW